MNSNILFLGIDSLRADHCHDHAISYGTPNFDQLIRNGIFFNQSVSCADGTALALGSIFTGLYPFHSNISTYKLKSKKPNFFTHLKKLGYHTYVTTPNSLTLDGLTANFSETNSEFHFKSTFSYLDEGFGNEIIKRLDKDNLKEPWIHFIYLLDLHKPIVIPKQFNSEKFGKNQYERAISVIDYWLGKFLEKIDLKSTLVVITSDHGEYVSVSGKRDLDYKPELTKTVNAGKKFLPKSFWPTAKKVVKKTREIVQEKRFNDATKDLTELEKRSLRSRAGWYLYDELLRIPLIFSGNNITENKIVKIQAANVDVFPTILDFIGLSQMDAQIDGQSLVPLKDESNIANSIYLETASILKDEPLGKMVGVRTSEYKYFRSRKSSNEKIHLYDLKNDPTEENNLASINHEMVREMELILSNFLVKSDVNISEELSDEETKSVEQELKKLGYL